MIVLKDIVNDILNEFPKISKVENNNLVFKDVKYPLDMNIDDIVKSSSHIDWKAISHCMRAIYQTQELLEHGIINYPLKNANTVLRIKRGEIAWPIVEAVIELGLENIENTNVRFNGVWDQEFVDNSVLIIHDLL
jgi:hypothetical protein